MSFALVDHRQAFLHEAIRSFEGGAGLTERGKIFSLALIGRGGIMHKQPDRGVCRIVPDARRVD